MGARCPQATTALRQRQQIEFIPQVTPEIGQGRRIVEDAGADQRWPATLGAAVASWLPACSVSWPVQRYPN